MTPHTRLRGIFLFLFVIVVGVGVGCARKDLFEPPQRTTPERVSHPESDSTLTLALRIPFDGVSQAASKAIPKQLTLNGGGRIGCVGIPYFIGPQVGSREECANIPYCDFRGCGTERRCAQIPTLTGPSVGTRNECADYNWNATVVPEGNMTLSRSADALRLEQPLKINGQAGLSGDLAKILSLSAKNFEAVARPGIDAQVDLSDRWCPVVNATPTMNWVSHAAVEMIGKNCLGVDLPGFGRQEVCAGPVNVDLTQYVNDAIGKTRDDIKTAIQSALPCDLVKKPVSEQWRTVAIPIEPMPGERLFVNITPKSAAFSGLQVEERAVRVAIRLGARTQVSDTAIAPQSLPLPPLERITAGSSSLALSVQAQVRYDRLARVLGGTLAGSVFEEQTPAGAVRVRIDEASIYPSQTSLVIGLKVDAKIPGQAFDTSGWVYLYGQPVADSNGRALSIESLRYATVLDNRFWSATSALFNGKILAFLRSHSKVDLADLLRDTASAVSKSLNEARLDGLVLKTDVPQISLRSVALGPQGVVAVVGLAMPFELQVDVAALAGRLP